MAKCPKCGYKLKLWNVSQFCPNCKTNMRFYNFEEEFIKSAKIAELNQAAFHVKMKRLKASFVGSKLMIVRLAVSVLPILMLLIPAGNFCLNVPYKSVDFSMSLLGIVNLFMGTDLQLIADMQASKLVGADFAALLSAYIAYIIPAFFAVATLVSTILAFISIKNMQKVICVFSALGIASAIAAQVVLYLRLNSIEESILLTGNSGIGLYISVVAFAVVFLVNFVIHKNGVPVSYDEGMVERAAIYKKYKAGEINIDELSQPVVETAETRKIEEQIRIEEEKIEKAVQLK